MAGHAQLKFVMTECSKTQIRLTGLIYSSKQIINEDLSLVNDYFLLELLISLPQFKNVNRTLFDQNMTCH